MNRQSQQAGNRKNYEAFMVRWEPRVNEIKWLYQKMNWSQARIAAYYDVHLAVLQKAMGRLGVKSRGRSRRGKLHPNFKHGKATVLYRVMIVKDKCRNCGTTECLSIHHKNDDHYDNRLENLEILCEHCHISLAKKRWWAAKKAGLPTPKSNGPVGWKSRQL